MDNVKVFAPATVANVGPGFDIFGICLDGIGDIAIAKRKSEPGVFIKSISGDNGKLPIAPDRNTVSIAAMSFLERHGITDEGIELMLEKGMPINSGLGSSGASAVAGAFASLSLFGDSLDKVQVLQDCVNAEAAVAGRHADNVAASLLGGMVIIRSYEPLDVIKLPMHDGLFAALATPNCEIQTKAAREILPKDVPLNSMVRNSGNVASLVSGIMQGDLRLIGRSIDDCIVEPVRGKLIPGFDAVKKAALEAGAFGCSISGSGPTVFAFASSIAEGNGIARAMAEAFSANGLASKTHVSPVNKEGAKVIR